MSFEIAPGCDACGICVFACPRGAIRRAPAGAAVPFEVVSLACNDCGKCGIVCHLGVLGPDPAWAECLGRGCPLTSARFEGWACTEGWARCPECGSALWKPPEGGPWRCARCDLQNKVICPKIRRAVAQTRDGSEPSPAGPIATSR